MRADVYKGPYADGNDRLTEHEATDIVKDCKQEGDLYLIKSR
ncbi:MAG TPA: hypothetical protein VFB82_08615 [Blastocatellia bacterium]|nr:hypothetical protein [Blastocatellia bacterium]